ncbi:MAG: 50S ribosomal protein L23 [Actinobacteria bacterium]|nr:50S ribosomal protein L23 [Actinomycetota bacterium]
MRDLRDVILKPIVSEKSYDLIKHRKYTFAVHPDAEKIEIRRAVEEIFQVTTTGVNTISMKGKPKRQGRTKGKRSDWKKAIVTLREGDKIEFFEGK